MSFEIRLKTPWFSRLKEIIIVMSTSLIMFFFLATLDYMHDEMIQGEMNFNSKSTPKSRQALAEETSKSATSIFKILNLSR